MDIKKKRFKNSKLFILIIFLIQDAYAGSPLRIVGSSAVFPFAATVGEHFSHKTHEPIPLIEAIGTGAGIKLFCGSLNGPEGVITSRPMTESEKKRCAVQHITFENFKIGTDGLILIQSKKALPFPLTLKNLNSALAEKLPYKESCIKNPYRTWSAIQKDLPPYTIRVLGPAPATGTYDVLVDKILGPCGSHLRRDGTYIEAPANENLIIQKVLNAPQTIGIVTFSFYDQNKIRLNALPIDGVLPSIASIQQGSYPLSRPLYLYIKTNELKDFPSPVSYVLEFLSKDAIGEKGYLTEKGLIPLSPQEQKEMRKRAHKLQHVENS